MYIYLYTRGTIVPRLIQIQWLTDQGSIVNYFVGFFVNLLVDCVLGICVVELATSRFQLWFGAGVQQHAIFFSQDEYQSATQKCEATRTKSTWKNSQVASIQAAVCARQ